MRVQAGVLSKNLKSKEVPAGERLPNGHSANADLAALLACEQRCPPCARQTPSQPVPMLCCVCRTHAVTKIPEWKAPLQIVKYPDPRLRATNARIAVFDEELLKLAKAMIEVMYQCVPLTGPPPCLLAPGAALSSDSPLSPGARAR